MTMPSARQQTDARPNLEAPSVWVGCLACYNGGKLVGDWFDPANCPTDIDEFAATGIALPRAHHAGSHEELWVFDHQGFDGLLTGECSPIEARRLRRLLDLADQRGIPVAVLAYWVNDDNRSADPDELIDNLQDAYCGHFDSEADYAEQLAEDIGAAPGTDVWPYYCVDWERAWRELNFGGDNLSIPAPGGGVYVLRTV
jgi:antirestriction protein